jgi:acyl carrier protein
LDTHHPISGSAAFPAAEVETCIRAALDAEHAAQQVLRPRAASACEPEVDSLVVVEVICAIEEFLGVNLPASFAPRGGYADVEACVSGLLSEARAVWMESSKAVEAQHV